MLSRSNTRTPRTPPRTFARAFGISAAAAALAGCASSNVGRAGPPPAPPAGARWETVFLTPEPALALSQYDETTLPGYDRLDPYVNFAPPQAQVATSQWPQPDRPTLERGRYITLPHHANTIIFFVPANRPWGW